MCMRIGIDATPLTQVKAGIGNCIFYWLDALLAIRPEYQFYLYAPTSGKDLEYFTRYPNVAIRTNALLAQSHSVWGQSTLAYLLYQDRMDAFWATTQLYPWIKRKRMRVLLTLHDFVYLLYPETSSFLKRSIQKLLSKSLFQRADYILPNSHGTAQRLKEYYGLDHHVVVEPPIKPWLKPIDARSWPVNQNLRYKEYLLAVGTLEPRKNLEAILSAYADILSAHDLDTILPLVVMGGAGWKNGRLKKQLLDLQTRYPQKVVATGYVPDEDEWQYLAGARYLLLLSHYEGYGMPIAEARSCGTEVICSDTPEMREAAQNCGIFLQKPAIASQLPLYFNRFHPLVRFPTSAYPTNQEKAARIAHVLDSIAKTVHEH